MADSDDEYDRRRRDKFRRERSDYDRSREREDRRRDDWSDRRPSAREWDRGRERRSRGEYRDYERGRRERFSPPRHDMSPQPKRMRRDWDDHGGDPYHGGYDLAYGGGGGPSYAPPQPWGHPDMHLMQPHHGIPIQARLGNIHDMELGPPPPVMKSFKEFLLSLDDSVDETESVKRYNEYKIDFRRQQMQDFFLAHKDEEWFRSKYHPDEAGKRKADAHAALQNRLSVFMYLLENSWFDSVSMDIDRAPQIIKILDAAVIKMEGGMENDLRILEQPVEEDEEREKPLSEPPKRDENRPVESDRKPSTEKADKESGPGDAGVKEAGAAAAGSEAGDKPDKEPPAGEIAEPKKLSKKRKRKRSGDSEDEASASESDSDSDSDSDSHCSEKPAEREREREEGEDKEEEEEGEADAKARKEEKQKEREKEKEEKKAKEDQPPRPRPLHKTCSLFMRSIAPSISKAEIIALCRRYPGFMRVCLSEPQPERRFFRRCWVTFDRGVNIKEICWNLQNIRLRDCELAPVVNRDLARRVRNINGITQHKQVLRNDIKLAAKLIHAMDEREKLWSHRPRAELQVIELPTQNPILKNITDYLIEEVSAEEEELLGSVGGADSEEGNKEGNPTEITVERDDKLVKVLDRLLFYLRIVHSIDYYNTCEYPSEDEMPNRCGIIHVRGPIPPNRITHREVSDWEKTFEEKLGPLFSVKETLSEDEAVKMGRKDPEQEVEKFVSANTQELGKDKWLCPLSGKKFKGPEFVRKHILNKHGDKIEEVKKEVEFFNNFLMDAKRPSLPEMKPPPPPGPGQGVLSPGGPPFPPQAPQGLMGFGQPRPPVMGYGGGGPPYPPNQYGGGGRGNYDNFRGQGGYPGKPRNSRMMRGDPRNIIEYRDLDAPDDVDFF
ncbi:serrate RNA effector molecule homolog isoform X1 [Electrophorus electricus]|uniref:Serrate RNA effector molecule homolog n=1 Tax=Electrophorus electricus TaxID=8005 RepID=A0A4W4H3R2_ELEEL|nr:serrate RNA effector molecule homolog isoform X1 [Electrophorus electricus]XP_026854387.2 serrate RNA effector molecule homolog isoform X1 [Electrophorus electricus]